MRILVIEDERKLANAVKRGLEADGYSVALARTGEEGSYLIYTQPFDLVVLDVVLPGRDGFEIFESLREQSIRVPILLLTARDAVEDRVRGWDTGAYDYLVKPFAFPELLARLRGLLCPGTHIKTGSFSKVGDLEIDLTSRYVSRDGQKIALTSKEYEILEYLFINKGRIVAREMLARDIWKDISRQSPLDNVIDVHVMHLQRKINGRFDKKLLHIVRGLGLALREESV